MADLINPNTFIESIKKGSQAPVKDQVTVVQTGEPDTGEPSSVGGLLALGATMVGAATLGRRIPGLRNYFKIPKPIKQPTVFNPTKPVATGNMPTATGQASDLITTEPSTSKALVRMKSRIGEVQDVPFSYGAGYSKENPLVGSAVFDRVMEAPFDKAPAKQWAKWLQDANRGDLKVSTGPLAGVSRQVQGEELSDLNLIAKGRDGKFTGFLKYADDNNMEIDRDALLNIVRNHPVNNIKKVVLDVEGDPISTFKDIQTNLYKNIYDKMPEGPKKSAAKAAIFDDISDTMDGALTRSTLYGETAIPMETVNSIQRKIIDFSRNAPENQAAAQAWLKDFNKAVGNFNLRATPLDEKKIFKSGNISFEPKGGRSSRDYYPRYRGYNGGQYNLLAGENYAENVYVFDGRIPNTRGDRFNYIEGTPHYFSNKELVFARVDDLPNPKLGNVRHMRISEVQSDLHSPGKAAEASTRENFFKNRVNTFNSDALVQDLKNKRIKLLDQLTPYTEIGRGALTRAQEQTRKKLMYELQQLDRDAVNKLATAQGLDSTTYGPMGNNINDYVIKDLLRTMADKKINAISVVPAPMNQNVKGLFSSGRIGNEINYGMMDGKRLTRTSSGKLVKSSKFSELNESLNRIARQYGAKFQMMPMPKSNPNKRFKVIEKIKVDDDLTDEMIGRVHFNTKDNKGNRIFENHLSAADSEEAANRIAGTFRSRGSPRGDIEVIELSPDSPRNYENVMTLVAPDNVLKKFQLPFKAYMYEGGLVDKTNIFKSII